MTYAVAAETLCIQHDVAYPAPMDRAVDDSALMLRYRDGDTAAFETLYRRHNDALFRYLLRLCRHSATAEDVFQEAWGKIIKARATYRPTAKFSTFLYRVAHNCFIDHLRRNQRHNHPADVEPDTQAADIDGHGRDRAADVKGQFRASLGAQPAGEDAFLMGFRELNGSRQHRAGRRHRGGARPLSEPPASEPRVGLCAHCRLAVVQRSARGSRFWRCGRADADPSFRRYPPLPVDRCSGHDEGSPVTKGIP